MTLSEGHGHLLHNTLQVTRGDSHPVVPPPPILLSTRHDHDLDPVTPVDDADTVRIDNTGGGRPSYYSGSTPKMRWADGRYYEAPRHLIVMDLITCQNSCLR